MAAWDDQVWDVVDEAVRRIEHARRAGKDADLTDILPSRDDPQREQVLLTLIKVDQEDRWRHGERKTLEAYLQEWPELANKPKLLAELLEAECTTRALVDAVPDGEEIRARFPDICQQLDLPQIQAKAAKDLRALENGAAPDAASDTSAVRRGETVSTNGYQAPLKAGDRFGRYEIGELLGEGGMGAVYRAYDSQLEREVALKIPRFDAAIDLAAIRRFVSEGKAAAKIAEHPNICTIYDAGESEGTYYITMRLIRGPSLASLIAEDAIQPSEAAEIMRKISLALETVHSAGIVHRDVKPSNVMIDESGEPVVMDFGLAHREKTTTESYVGDTLHAADSEWTSHAGHSGALLGTPLYMSPEQATGDPVDARSDIYGLGVLLYQMLTGKLPFTGSLDKVLEDVIGTEPPKPRELLPDLPEELESICLTAMAKSPADRYQAAGELSEALGRYIDRTKRRVPSRPWRRALLGTLATLAFLLGGVFLVFKTGKGSLIFEVNESTAKVTIDGKTIPLDTPHKEISIPVGVHTLEVEAPGFSKRRQTLRIRWRNSKVEIKVCFDRQGKTIPIQRWIETGGSNEDICLSPDGLNLYATYCFDGNDNTPIGQFDVASGRRIRTMSFESGEDPDRRIDHKGVVLSGDGRYLFTTNYYGRYISRLDLQNDAARMDLDITADDRVRHTWAVRLGITPDKTKLVVPAGSDGRLADEKNDRVSIIEAGDGNFRLLAEVPLDDEPKGNIRFSADSQFAYLITRQRKSDAPKLYEIRLTPPYGVARTLPFPEADLRDVALSGSQDGTSVAELARVQDPAPKGQRTKDTNDGEAPQAARAFVSDARHNNIWIVDLDTFQTTSEIDLGEFKPDSLAFSHRSGLLAALAPKNRTLFCVAADDTRQGDGRGQGEIVGKVTGLRPDASDVEFSKDDERLFVAHWSDQGGVAVIDIRHLLFSIVFASDRAGESYQIYRMDGDGRGVVRLTDNHATERSPRWSPDGKTIAFVSDRQGPARVLLMDRDGQHVSVLERTHPTMNPSFEIGSLIDWSSDGREIAYIAKDGRAIHAVDINTQQIRTIVDGPVGRGYDYHNGICWRNSDGAILFSSQQATWGHNQDVFQCDPNTGNVTQITNAWGEDARYFTPAPSADGRLVLLRRPERRAPPCEILLANPDGSELTVLKSATQALHANPGWFPTGKEILYCAKVGQFFHIYALKLKDKDARQLTAGEFNDIEPHVISTIRPKRARPQMNSAHKPADD